MANGKRTTREGRPTLSVKTDKGEAAKTKVEKMFQGEGGEPTRSTEAVNDSPPTMKVEAEIPLPAHADPDAENPSVRDIKDRVEALFTSIGTLAMPGTAYPTGGRNNGPEAAEFVLSDQLRKMAEDRFKKAKDAADASGCFGDPEKYVAGETTEVYRTPNFTFSVKKGRDTQAINRDNVEAVLKKHFPGKWQELMQECLGKRNGPTQIIISLR